MISKWGVVGCAYMSREYCKVLLAKGVEPAVYSRDLASPNVASFQQSFPQLPVREIADIDGEDRKWLVCTNIESHAAVCAPLKGEVYCEKPFAMTSDYETDAQVSMLMNRRYYYWVDFIREIIDRGDIAKVIACIPEKSIDALVTQSIHVVDLIWYLTGSFEKAQRVGNALPTYIMSTAKDIPLVINMNYGAHENFSVKFYAHDGTLYEARPLEWFATSSAMEVCEPDDDLPIRTYRPVTSPLAHTFSTFKPGLEPLIDDLLNEVPGKLPDLAAHRQLQVWMEDNML